METIMKLRRTAMFTLSAVLLFVALGHANTATQVMYYTNVDSVSGNGVVFPGTFGPNSNISCPVVLSSGPCSGLAAQTSAHGSIAEAVATFLKFNNPLLGVPNNGVGYTLNSVTIMVSQYFDGTAVFTSGGGATYTN